MAHCSTGLIADLIGILRHSTDQLRSGRLSSTESVLCRASKAAELDFIVLLPAAPICIVNLLNDTLVTHEDSLTPAFLSYSASRQPSCTPDPASPGFTSLAIIFAGRGAVRLCQLFEFLLKAVCTVNAGLGLIMLNDAPTYLLSGSGNITLDGLKRIFRQPVRRPIHYSLQQRDNRVFLLAFVQSGYIICPIYRCQTVQPESFRQTPEGCPQKAFSMVPSTMAVGLLFRRGTYHFLLRWQILSGLACRGPGTLPCTRISRRQQPHRP